MGVRNVIDQDVQGAEWPWLGVTSRGDTMAVT